MFVIPLGPWPTSRHGAAFILKCRSRRTRIADLEVLEDRIVPAALPLSSGLGAHVMNGDTAELSAPGAPQLAVQSDTGPGYADGITRDNGSAAAPLVFTVGGISPPDAEVQLYDDTKSASPNPLGSPVQATGGSAIVSLDGGTGVPLADGTYSIAASAEASAGGTPSALSATTTVTIQTSLQVTGVSPSGNALFQYTPPTDVVVTFNHWLAGLTPDVANGSGLTSVPFAVMVIPSGPDGSTQLAQTGTFWSAPSGVDDGDLPLPATMVYHQNADGTSTITLTPNQPLTTDVYLISVGGVTDLAGNSLTGSDGVPGDPVFTGFYYRVNTIFVAPSVSSVTAFDGSVVIDNNRIPQPDTIGISFTALLDAYTVNANTIGLYESTGSGTYAEVPSAVAYSPTTNTAYLTPEATLTPGTVYVVSVSGSVSGIQGFPSMGDLMGQPYYTSFTVAGPGAGAGPSPLKVLGTTPANGTPWSAPLGYAAVTFSEGINLAGFGRFSAMLTTQTGGVSPNNSGYADVPLNAKVAFNPNTNQLIIVPTGLLPDNTVYLFTLQDVTATNGDALAGPVYSTFLLDSASPQVLNSASPRVAVRTNVGTSETAITPSDSAAATVASIPRRVSVQVGDRVLASPSRRPQRAARNAHVSIFGAALGTTMADPLGLRNPNPMKPSRR